MKETYQIVSIKDGKQDLADILLILRKIKAGSLPNDLKLLNYYHEVPISYTAKIDAVEADSIEVSAQKAQAVVLGLQKQCLMTSAHFPQGLGVHCFVEYVNAKNCCAVLGRFAYASIRAHRRAAVRVKVEEHIQACYKAAGQEISGQISDISASGIALESQCEAPAGLEESGFLAVFLQGKNFNIPAQHIKSRRHDEVFIHSFRIEPDKQADTQISQYVYSRQVEIIRQLKEQL